MQLDYTLARVRRLTAEEGRQAEKELEEIRAFSGRRSKSHASSEVHNVVHESDGERECGKLQGHPQRNGISNGEPETEAEMLDDAEAAGDASTFDEYDVDELDVMQC